KLADLPAQGQQNDEEQHQAREPQERPLRQGHPLQGPDDVPHGRTPCSGRKKPSASTPVRSVCGNRGAPVAKVMTSSAVHELAGRTSLIPPRAITASVSQTPSSSGK